MLTVERDPAGGYREEYLALAHRLDCGCNATGLDAMANSRPEQSQFLAFDDSRRRYAHVWSFSKEATLRHVETAKPFPSVWESLFDRRHATRSGLTGGD